MGKNTGVICSQDDRTLPIYQAARLLNWDIPDDIGIIGYFNTPWVDTFFPSLTSVSIKEKEIAKKTSEIIIKNEEKEIIIKPELVVRDSTRR